MNCGPLFAAGLLAAALSNFHVTTSPTFLVQAGDRTNSTPSAQSLPAMPGAGEQAPDFTYQSHDDLWQTLHNMLEQGNVLLVFGAGDEQLRALERSREAMVRRGVLPVAVVERRDDDVWSTVRRLNLTYSLLSDPHATIAEQYGVLDRGAHRAKTAWFVIDRNGRVRGSGDSFAATADWSAVATAALGVLDVKAAGAN